MSFKDKYDLMNWVYKIHVDTLLTDYGELTAEWQWLLEITRFVRRKKDYFRKIIHYQSQNSFSDFLYDYSLSDCMERASEYFSPRPVPAEIEYAIKIFCNGCCQVIVEWNESGCKETAERMAQFIQSSVPPPIEKLWSE